MAADAPPPIWVSEPVVDLYGFAPGQRGRRCRSPDESLRFTVAGVLRDYARQQGAIVIDRERYIALTGDRRATDGALWLAPGATADALRETIAREIPGGGKLEIVDAGRDPRGVAVDLRPHLRRHLRAGARRGGDRARRPVVVVRRAGARAAARVRHAAPPRHDAAARSARCWRPKASPSAASGSSSASASAGSSA